MSCVSAVFVFRSRTCQQSKSRQVACWISLESHPGNWHSSRIKIRLLPKDLYSMNDYRHRWSVEAHALLRLDQKTVEIARTIRDRDR